MATNFKTKEVNLTGGEGWVALGNPSRQDTLVDLFNESDVTVRLYMGSEIASGDDVPSIPIAAGCNYYIECIDNTSKMYVKSDSAALISFVEG